MKIKSLSQTYGPMVCFVGLTLILTFIAPALAQPSEKEVEYEAGFYYTVKPGDTLWDISQRFNDTPWQWPDLWKENQQLPNPHWIYPGERIRLFRKGDKHRYQEEPVPAATPTAQATAPEPLPEPEVHFYYPRADRYGFIRKPAVDPLGMIFKSKEDKGLISQDDLVYLRPVGADKSGAFAAGTRLTVYRTLKPIDTRDAEETIGTQHYLLGVVEVIQSEDKYAIAKVIDNFDAIHVGDLLMPYQTRSLEFKVNDSTPGIRGAIIATEEHADLVSSDTTAFIDRGKIDNILPGQIYTISYQETVPDPNDQHAPPITLAPVDVGSLIVLHTEEANSTVYITSSRGKITPGFMIRTP